VFETVAGVAGFVADPLLVNLVVHPWLDPHYLNPPRVNVDVGTEGIRDINGLGVFELLQSGLERIGFARERTVWA
jgi:hypothetical protein